MVTLRVPSPATPFVGRDEELSRLTSLLADPGCRLLTVVGVGGIGKTRLALQAGAQYLAHFANGVYFVPLAPVSSPDLIAAAIGAALQVSFYGHNAPVSRLFITSRKNKRFFCSIISSISLTVLACCSTSCRVLPL